MSLTPTHPRMALSLRSPTRAARPDAHLALRQVIGTTATGANAVASVPTGACFAYTAGAGAVLASVDAEHAVSQRFFRARPAALPLHPAASLYGPPATPAQNESRNRTAASLRDAGFGLSPAASPATADWPDSPSSRAWSSRDKIKAATCVSLSPDGRFLAVGETGYKPRVLVFSTARDAPADTPLAALADHTFGVNCLAFSPDARYLASLGSANDGFLHVWAISPRTGAAALHASNKCVSHVNRMAWMGTKIITVGTRHVKVWRVEEQTGASASSGSSAGSMRIKARPSDVSFLSSAMHKTLPGRNCILDGLKDATFTSVVAITPNSAIIASDKGELCLLDDTGAEQRFFKLADAGFPVSSMALDVKGRLHIGGSQGGLKTLYVDDLVKARTPPSPPPWPRVESPTVTAIGGHQIGAVACLNDYVITVDSQRAIRLSHLGATHEQAMVGDLLQMLPAHGDAVLGVHAGLSQPNELNASYYTWAADGTILFWSQGSSTGSLQVPLEQLEGPDALVNELRTARVLSDGSFLLAGDKYGVLRIMNCKTKVSAFDFKAHANEITSIAIHEEENCVLLACASRDRTVQVFLQANGSWDILQTLDEHVGAVNGVTFSQNGLRLVSSSSDRTLVVRELVTRVEQDQTFRAFVMLRAIILKASPVSMAWDADSDDALLVSTIDRQVHKVDTRNGQCLSNFKACDTDGGDAVVLSSLVHIPRSCGAPLIAGVSSTDKSIRVYDDNGSLLARDWGHTEGVSDIALVQTSTAAESDSSEKSIVTVAVDGTIFVWGLALQLPPNRSDITKSLDLVAPSTPTNPDLLATKPPLRRVFSQSELARFQRSPHQGDVTPTGSKSPKLRKRISKFVLAPTPKFDPSPMQGCARDVRAGDWKGYGTTHRNKNRSPSPPSPRHPAPTKRRASIDVRVRAKAPTSEFGSIGSATESLCRTLRAYRKRLANSSDTMSSEHARDVERELAATARAVGDRVKSKEFDETVMVKLLDQYSERLVNLLDDKITASVAQRVRESSVFSDSGGGSGGGAESPMLEQRPGASRQNSAFASQGSRQQSLSGEEQEEGNLTILETTEKCHG